MSGYITLHKKLADNSIWTSETFTRGQAWVDLLMITNHKPGYVRKQGVRVNLERGDCGWGEVELGKRWKWSRGKVSRFLAELVSDGMIVFKFEQAKDKRTRKITVVNYNTYQPKQTTEHASIDTSDGQATGKRQDRKNKGLKDKNNNAGLVLPGFESTPKMSKIPPKDYTDDFHNFWLSYPKRNNKREGKLEAFKLWWAVIYEGIKTKEELLTHVTEYGRTCGDYPVDAKKWLRNRSWEDNEDIQGCGKKYHTNRYSQRVYYSSQDRAWLQEDGTMGAAPDGYDEKTGERIDAT